MQTKPIPDQITSQGLSETFLSRFFSRIKYTDTCWLWTGYIMKNGYGTISKGPHSTDCIGGVSVLAHRASWLIHFGAIPDGLFVCHQCDTGRCVNPAHLWLGTHKENMADMKRKGRESHNTGMFAGDKSYMAKLTWDQVRMIRSEYNSGAISQAILSEKFGVSRSVISGILTNTNWIDASYARPFKTPKRLSATEKETIKQRYANENISQQALAELLGVSQVCISLIIRRKRQH